jgi:hypothetical protein
LAFGQRRHNGHRRAPRCLKLRNRSLGHWPR